MFFDKKNLAFVSTLESHHNPDDFVYVDDESYRAIMDEHYATSKKIVADSVTGYPQLQEVIHSTEFLGQRVRSERDRLLSESDWTMLSDVPLSRENKAKWKLYRQQLRDITKQSGFPYDVTFPVKPE